LSKAFDCIDHTLLLEQISSTDLHPNIIRWLASYIRGRTARCLYGSSLSIQMIIRSGVPQGSVLSPALFNFFVSDCPGNADDLAAYADDITAVKSDPNLSVLGDKLQEAVIPIAEWADRKKLYIAPSKSQVTLFTPWNQQFDSSPEVSINDVDIPLCRTPKILGVTFDTMFTFSHHVAAIASKAL
jgi:hypothetical protein